jgi:hypothetical protein
MKKIYLILILAFLITIYTIDLLDNKVIRHNEDHQKIQ